MAVGFTVKYYWYQIGTEDFLHSFFSTIAYNLEDKQWGTKYPMIMNELYSGKLNKEHLVQAMNELNMITQELKQFSCDRVIWDIDDLSKPIPWGDNISADITDLSNYYVTSDGEDLISMLRHAMEKAIELKTDLCISTL